MMQLIVAKGLTQFYTVNCREEPNINSKILRKLDVFGEVLLHIEDVGEWGYYEDITGLRFYLNLSVILRTEHNPTNIDMEYISQNDKYSSKYPNDCGAASALMMIKHYNNYNLTVDEIAEQMGIVGKSFSSFAQIIKITNRYNTRLKYVRPIHITDVVQHLPALVLVNYGQLYANKNYGHFLIVKGYNKNVIITHDPNTKENQEYPFRQFVKALAQVGTNNNMPFQGLIKE